MSRWSKDSRAGFTLFVCASVLLAAAWVIVGLFGEEAAELMFSGDSLKFLQVPSNLSRVSTPADSLLLLRRFLLVLTVLLVIALILWSFRKRLARIVTNVFGVEAGDTLANRILSFCMLGGCSWVCFHTLIHHGYEGEWYLIEDMMNFVGNSPFNHRILLVLPANLLKLALPGLSAVQAYCLSQLVPIVLTFYFVMRWAKLFVSGILVWLAQLILLAMLVPTISYYNFYDFAVVMFFTLCLLLLFRRKFLAYYAVFALGILNHEIMLLMVFFFTAMFTHGDMNRSRLWGSITLQLAIYVAIRWILFQWLPATQAVESGKMWFNIDLILHRPVPFLSSLLSLLFWYVIGLLGIKYAPNELRRCVLVLPVLVLITLFAGQFNEPRQFDCFIPIVVALILCFLGRKAYSSSNHQKVSLR